MSEKSSRILYVLSMGIMGGAFIVMQYWAFWLNPYPCEDAYISYRFARNGAEGLGLVFNAGERVEGYSNFLWVIALALAHRLGVDMITFSRVAGAVCNALAFLLVWLIPQRLFPVRGWASLLGPALYLLYLPFYFYAACGLETSLYTCELLLCIAAIAWAGDNPRRFAAASILFVLIALTRPEGITCCALYVAYLVWRAVRAGESCRPYLPGIILGVCAYGVFLLWRMSYYGLLVPNTYYAKGTYPFMVRIFIGFSLLKGFVGRYPQLGLLPLLLLGFARPSLNRHLVTILLFLAAGLLFSLGFATWDWMPFFRYTLPIVPLIIILLQLLFARLWQTLSASGSRRQQYVWACITGLFLWVAVEQCVADLSFNLRWKQLNHFADHHYRTAGHWLKNQPGRKPLIALGDVGRLAYYADAQTLDIFGLTSRQFARLRHTFGAPALSLSDLTLDFNRYKQRERELLLASAPDYIFFYSFRLRVADSFPGSARGIVEHHDFKERYEYMSSLTVFPEPGGPAWPKLHYYIDVLDLSTGILAWLQDAWGYDIYRRKDSAFKRFTFEYDSQGVLQRIAESPS